MEINVTKTIREFVDVDKPSLIAAISNKLLPHGKVENYTYYEKENYSRDGFSYVNRGPATSEQIQKAQLICLLDKYLD